MSHPTKAVSLALIGVTLGASALAQEAAAGMSSEPLEEIVVSGTRAALAESRDKKREAAVVRDLIVAEDLGRFPDDNVADSLSHITGITLQRTAAVKASTSTCAASAPSSASSH